MGQVISGQHTYAYGQHWVHAYHTQASAATCPLSGNTQECLQEPTWLPWPWEVSGSCCPAYCMGMYAGTNSAMDADGAHCGTYPYLRPRVLFGRL